MQKKWWQVFNGDAEKRIFVGKDGTGGLVRGKDDSGKEYKWRSLRALVEESDLSVSEVEDILTKFIKNGLILQNEKGDKYGYWEKVAPHLALPPGKTAIEADQESRINKAAHQ